MCLHYGGGFCFAQVLFRGSFFLFFLFVLISHCSRAWGYVDNPADAPSAAPDVQVKPWRCAIFSHPEKRSLWREKEGGVDKLYTVSSQKRGLGKYSLSELKAPIYGGRAKNFFEQLSRFSTTRATFPHIFSTYPQVLWRRGRGWGHMWQKLSGYFRLLAAIRAPRPRGNGRLAGGLARRRGDRRFVAWHNARA